MKTVQDAPNGAIIVHPFTRLSQRSHDPEAALSEAIGLSCALNLVVCDALCLNVKKVIPATFIGGGAIENLAERLGKYNAKILVFDGQLTPVQQRNLEERLQVKVLDRTGLILEIFSLRAKTKEGRLQVELARIAYERSRLVRTWTHLERQRGGKGFLAGPGERQIESDRRELADEAIVLGRRLDKIKRTRSLHRKARIKRHVPMVALVGYTNAGKSTLFNRLTDADVLVKDMLFATLDPTIRDVQLPGRTKAVLSDTVGFISNLPTELIAAFRATLEEVTQADLVLHVRDIACLQSEKQKHDVEEVLKQLHPANGKMPTMVEVWNKMDLLTEENQNFLRERAAKLSVPPILISAETGEGTQNLLERVASILHGDQQTIIITLPAKDSSALNWLHQHGRIVRCDAAKNQDLECEVTLDVAAMGRFQAQFPELMAGIAS
ncbi:MAG: GTPase HflX [Robiginitomaculum sp.]|nr:GTPase HflX [Robiginitomaculum sp.]